MGKITVKFCISNLINGSLSTYYRLKNQNHPQIQVRAERCLGYCGRCVDRLYALVDRQMVEADTPDELYEKIAHYLHLQVK